MQREVNQKANKWGRVTGYLGLVLVITGGTWFFLFSRPAVAPAVGDMGQSTGRDLLCILLPLVYAAATTVNLWYYRAELRKIDRDFATGRFNR